MKKTLTIVICLVANLFTPYVLADHQPVIHNAWIADAPAIAKIRAGYLTIHNEGKHPFIITKFSSPDFQRVELHKTVIADGMVKMEHIQQLTIKLGQHIEFKPGGYHLMLFTPQRNLEKGDKVNLTIQLNDKITTSFTLTVRKRGDNVQDNHDHHSHH